ncbi:hypothetical protein DA717_12030 [Piscirickettsiaceae bacterium NZ-RLO2]|uniref:hypothetical protein n=1 Tax=Piscirickettsia salmonis TaxID=1238 RepID=UPI000F090D4F|nr:hypothetical protein DA717_12030 [Piscirickettsiaceae bacterium NZ-RLO2]
MNADQLLAIGAALVTAVRRNIKYSENIPYLYSNEQSEPFKKERSDKLYSIRDKLRAERNPITGRMKGAVASAYAKEALNKRVGFCNELSEVTAFLGSMLNKIDEPVYISVVATPHHAFCLIHQSQELHQQEKAGICIADNFKELCEKKELENAIIVDPWIYKASKLSNYQVHLDYAFKFGSHNITQNFRGKISTRGYSEEFSANNPVTVVEKRLLRDFKVAHQEEVQKLSTQPQTFAQGRRFSIVQADLSHDIQRWKQLKDLKLFIERIHSKSKAWYSHLGYNGRKDKSYLSLIECLDFSIQKYMEISDDDLQSIFNQALKLAPITRGELLLEERHTTINLKTTKTAEGLLSVDVVPRELYAFESIPGMSLGAIRAIQDQPLPDSEKYTHLIQWIKKEGDDPTLYTAEQKAATYKAVNDFVSLSQGEAGLLFYDRMEEAQPLAAEASAASFKSF